MIRLLVFAVRLVSYAALTIVVAGFAAVIVVSTTGLCSRFDEGAVQCASPFYAQLGGIGLFILLGSAFTVLPAMFAIAGAIFLIRDVHSLIRRHRS